MSKEVVYISGPSSSEDGEQKKRDFKRVLEVGSRLMEDGFVPVIPYANFHEISGMAKLTPTQSLRTRLALLKKCDSVFMMKGWKTLMEGRIEHYRARMDNKKVYYERTK